MFKFYKVFEMEVTASGFEQEKTVWLMIEELIFINILKKKWNQLLQYITFAEPKMCQYRQYYFKCGDWALPKKNICDVHSRLERRFHHEYHFVSKTKANNYMNVGIFYGDFDYPEELWNQNYSELVYENRHILIQTEIKSRRDYEWQCNYSKQSKQFGNYLWEQYLLWNFREDIDPGLFYERTEP